MIYIDYYKSCKFCPVAKYCGKMISSRLLCNSYKDNSTNNKQQSTFMETNNIPTVCTMCHYSVAIEMIDGSITEVPMEAQLSPEGFIINESLYRYDEISSIYGLNPVRRFNSVGNCRFTEIFGSDIDIDLKYYGIL